MVGFDRLGQLKARHMQCSILTWLIKPKKHVLREEELKLQNDILLFRVAVVVYLIQKAILYPFYAFRTV